ncbi:aspartate carbamoyltransferase [Candidatus Falkowbacteria bacterium]|nr:MAG: aspartate carbamoyltransferase [Candidatus Falkowbacteria bacterium]
MTQKNNEKKCEGCGVEGCQNCYQNNGSNNCPAKPDKLPANIIKSQQFDKKTIEYIFKLAGIMEKSPPKNLLVGKTMVTLFYEPSTRTRLSFELAMLKLGGSVVGTENAHEFSSAAKGETIPDTIRTICGYNPDVIVLRHFQEGSSKIAQKYSSVPIINAGDGPGQHPTQALLDLWTMKKTFGEIKNRVIAFIGDLINARTVRSLCYNLALHYPDNFLYFVSLAETRIKKDIKDLLTKYKVKWFETGDLNSILDKADIFYQTRIQKERFKNNVQLYEKIKANSERLIISSESLKKMKKDACIMHPLPRGPEIATDVDSDKRAIYFQQAENGLYIRMALLKMLLIDNQP